MKKLLTLLIIGSVTILNYSHSQQNSLPSSGNVGIGTLSPSVKLDVKGHVKIDSTVHVKDSILIDKNARIQQDLRVMGDLYLPHIPIENDINNVELLLKKPNGQVVTKDLTYIEELIYSKQCPADPNTDVQHPVWTNGLNKIFIDCPPVNVGIGNSTPKVKLHVSGPIAGSRLTLGVPDPENSSAKFHMKISGSPNSSKVFLIENNQRELFQINNDGIVRTREVKVNLDHPWPDYVFDDKYSLKTLSELENYIEKNGHLPNVPTAKQILEEGVALGEMNKILLEKVEELTLYLIEQEKRIVELENLIKQD